MTRAQHSRWPSEKETWPELSLEAWQPTGATIEKGQTYEVRVEPRHKASFAQRFAGRIETA